MNKKILLALIVVLVAVCGVSTYFHIKDRIESEENKKMYETVAEEVSATEDITAVSASKAAVNPYTEYKDGGRGNSNTQSYTDTMTFADNPDMVGWIKIDGTNINYPVMHTPSNPQKYLNKNFYGEYSFSGTPFLDARCSADSTNLIIYGHHMNNGTMFADLCNYTDYSYFAEHPTVVLETKDGVFAYSVFSVMKVKSDDDWYRFTTVGTEKSYNSRIEYAKEKSIYDTGITPVYGQQILTLSTCYGDNQNDRILVLAVRN